MSLFLGGIGTEISDLANDLDSVGAYLFWYSVGKKKAVTIEEDKVYGVFIDRKEFSDVRGLKEAVAHEIGHCATGCTHKVSSPLDLIEKHEYKANRWAIERYLPFEILNDAMLHGHIEVWDLADYFDVPEDMIIKAIRYYTLRRGLKFG